MSDGLNNIDLDDDAQGVAEPEFSTIDELSRRTRLDRKTLYIAANEGNLPGARRIGRSIRVHTATFLDWFRTQSSDAP